MGKFGKRVNVSADLSSYMIGVMAPSGYGKTTLMYQVCEKEFGPDGYIICDMGTENGTAALEGAVAEPIPNWKKMKEVVDDIVKNKETDYPDLKVLIIDTLDAAFEIAEEFCVKSWNTENMGKQGFTPATSINSVDGGFGKGLDRVIDTVKKEISRLNKVGVGVWWNAHVKEKDQTDLFTGANYTSLTANMTMKYFNSIKNSSHFIGFGYFDRNIEKQEVGDANPVTKKKKERKTVVGEVRKLKFRDDALIADAKSRFANVIDEIILDADEFIKSIKDAIEAERNKDTSVKTVKKAVVKQEQKVEVPVEEDPEIEAMEEIDESLVEDFDVETAITDIRAAFKTADTAAKAAVKTILAGEKLSADIPVKDLKEIMRVLGI